MLASILRLEELLKCDFCDNLLRSTRTLNECGHRFCETCIYDRLGTNRQCPKCSIPAIVKNLRKDPMHDTMIACVKKLKQCMMETDLASLSVPPFDATNANHLKSQCLPKSQLSSAAFLENKERSNPAPSQPLAHSYDSDATTQSSQHIPTIPEDVDQTTTTTTTNTRPPKLSCTPSTNDLLLAMEDEEVNEDDEPDNDIPTIPSVTINNVSPPAQPNPNSNLTPSVPPNHIYASSDDLLAAMASEDVVMNDDDEDDFSSAPPKSMHDASNRRRLSLAAEQGPNTKHQKTDTSQDQWRCSACLYGENEMHHLLCGVCQKVRVIDGLWNNEPTATVPLSLDASLPAQFMVPSTIASEMLPLSSQPTNQDKVVRMMVTALTAEDDAQLDISMTRAIDTCLRMEIYSDIRDVDNVTHLITSVNDQGLCTRTIKYLLCIMTGKWIVHTSWLMDSVQAGYWLPEESYQVIGDKTSGVTHGPARGRTQQQDCFFGDSIRFFFYGDFPENDTKLKLLQLVRQGGGKVISRRPPLDQLHQDDLVIIVPSLEMRMSRKKAHAWLEKCAHVKDSQWLLDSIARSNWVLE